MKLESNAEAEDNTGKHDTVPAEKRERVSFEEVRKRSSWMLAFDQGGGLEGDRGSVSLESN